MSFSILLALFVAVPIVELWLLFRVAAVIGPGGGLATFSLVILTGVVGAGLARRQGMKVVRAIQDDLSRGSIPTDHLLSGLLVLVGGLMLLTPGFLTDLAGLFLMVPGNRRLLIPPLKRRLAAHVRIGDSPLPGWEKEVAAREVGDVGSAGGTYGGGRP